MQNWKSRSAAISTAAAGASTSVASAPLAGGHREDRIALDAADHALEHADEALAARVHHPGFLEHRHELRGPGQGHFALREQPAHELADVVGLGGRALRGGRPPRARR